MCNMCAVMYPGWAQHLLVEHRRVRTPKRCHNFKVQSVCMNVYAGNILFMGLNMADICVCTHCSNDGMCAVNYSRTIITNHKPFGLIFHRLHTDIIFDWETWRMFDMPTTLPLFAGVTECMLNDCTKRMLNYSTILYVSTCCLLCVFCKHSHKCVRSMLSTYIDAIRGSLAAGSGFATHSTIFHEWKCGEKTPNNLNMPCIYCTVWT